MLDFLQSNAIWIFYALFIVLMVRMHLGHGAHGGHGGGDDSPAQQPGGSPPQGPVESGSQTPGAGRATERGHAH